MFERTLNAVWIALGLATCAAALQLGLAGPSGPDSGLFPFIGGALLALAGAALLARGRADAARSVEWPRGAGLRRVLTVLAGLAAMTALIPLIGFVVAAFVTMVVLLRAIERAGWVQVLALAAAATLAVHTLFVRLLAVLLPRGPWGF